MRLKEIILVIVFLTIYCVSDTRSLAQQPSKPKPQLPAVIQYDADMASILAHLAPVYGATIGLEVDPRQPRSHVTFYLRDPTLPDVLNAILKSAPSYQWRERNGCFEVLPLQTSNPLLDTIINNYRVTDVDQTEALNQLLNLPDVQANLRAMRFTRRDSGGASIGTKSEKFSLELNGVTMRQALSRIADESGVRFWIFRTFDDGSFSISNSPW